MENKTSLSRLLPVLLSFFVMSFCDLVGITIDRVKFPDIFNLGDFFIQFIPSVVFVWFFFLSIPVGVWQDRYGKKNILNVGILITALGLFIPYFLFSKAALFIGFALLGIGNTIVQVSANPLLLDVVVGKKAGYLSFSQFIKAIGSMVAPYVAAYCALSLGDWKLMFLVFGITSLVSVLWLWRTPIKEAESTEERATVGSALGLLKNNYVAFMALGIFLVVGLDVGINSISGQFLMLHHHSAPEYAEKGRSFYFFGKMVGTFLSALILAKVAAPRFLFLSALVSVILLASLAFAPTEGIAMMIIAAAGFSTAAIFPLIFSLTIEKYPTRANEISGLMIMAVSGGAVIPPVMGFINQHFGIIPALMVLVGCGLYLLGLSLRKKEVEREKEMNP